MELYKSYFEKPFLILFSPSRLGNEANHETMMVFKVYWLCFIGRFFTRPIKASPCLISLPYMMVVLDKEFYNLEFMIQNVSIEEKKNMVQCFTILINPQSKAKVDQVSFKFYRNWYWNMLRRPLWMLNWLLYYKWAQ